MTKIDSDLTDFLVERAGEHIAEHAIDWHRNTGLVEPCMACVARLQEFMRFAAEDDNDALLRYAQTHADHPEFRPEWRMEVPEPIVVRGPVVGMEISGPVSILSDGPHLRAASDNR